VLYQGEIADLLLRAMRENGGLITRDDLASYRPREVGPGLESSYRGVRLVGMPYATGCSTVYQALNLLENFDLAAEGVGSAGAYHLIAEASRRAFLDRFTYMADPASAPVPWEGLLSKEYARQVAATIDPRRATPEAHRGDPWPYQPGGRQPLAAPGGPGPAQESTTHITVVDRDRNMVALTSTLVSDFGSKVVVPGTGILLNNGMSWFNPEPGTVNSLGPRKRALWAVSPTLAFREGKPWLACGSPGGRKVMTAILQTLVNSIDFDLGPQEAVSRPRVHCEGPATQVDSRIDAEVLETLRDMGHRLDVREETFTNSLFARPNGVRIYHEKGELRAGVNQHKMAWAMGL
jgi:gamma-glutamyltranspeptidase/glutathione hydrolase